MTLLEQVIENYQLQKCVRRFCFVFNAGFGIELRMDPFPTVNCKNLNASNASKPWEHPRHRRLYTNAIKSFPMATRSDACTCMDQRMDLHVLLGGRVERLERD